MEVPNLNPAPKDIHVTTRLSLVSSGTARIAPRPASASLLQEASARPSFARQSKAASVLWDSETIAEEATIMGVNTISLTDSIGRPKGRGLRPNVFTDRNLHPAHERRNRDWGGLRRWPWCNPGAALAAKGGHH